MRSFSCIVDARVICCYISQTDLLLCIGIGLAHLCNAIGYQCVIFMPDTQSQVRQHHWVMTPLWLSALFNVYRKKIDALRVPGADVRPVPAVPYDNPENYNHIVSEFVNMSSIISEYDVLMSKYTTLCRPKYLQVLFQMQFGPISWTIQLTD